MKHEWTRINVVRITDFVEFVARDLLFCVLRFVFCVLRFVVRGQCFSVSVFQCSRVLRFEFCVMSFAFRCLWAKFQCFSVPEFCVLRFAFRVSLFVGKVSVFQCFRVSGFQCSAFCV